MLLARLGRAPVMVLGMMLGVLSFSGCSQEQKPCKNPETKNANDLFERWILRQKVFKDLTTESMNQHINEGYITAVKAMYREQAKIFEPMNDLIESIFAGEIKNGELHITLNDGLKRNVSFLYNLLDHDIAGFVDFLRHHGLESNELNKRDKEADYHDVIRQYYGIIQLLFANPDTFVESEYLFSLSNRLFEFFYGPKTWVHGQKMLSEHAMYPVARVFYATIWRFLSGLGWRDWNKTCLDALKKECDAGKKIIYIASGNDLYQLFKHGIYNIESIDPLLPSQPKFYADGWSWIIRDNGIGDKIELKFEHTELELRRVEFRTYGTFRAKLHTGLEEDVQKSMTRWAIYDKKSGKQLGNWVINRRFVTQDDFIMDNKKVLLLSFNELYFVTSTNPSKTWGIDPDKFPNDFRIYVKQLRAQVTKEIAQHMKLADESEFSFIALGSQIN